MSCSPALIPTLAGYIPWFYQATGIPDTVIPKDSPYFEAAFDTATATVNLYLTAAGGPIYQQAVYNLAAAYQVGWQPDPEPPVNFPQPTKGGQYLPWMQYVRQQYNLAGFVPGVTQATSNDVSSVTLEVSEAMKSFTLGQLQLTKTPWGQVYLGIAQSVGSLWALS